MLDLSHRWDRLVLLVSVRGRASRQLRDGRRSMCSPHPARARPATAATSQADGYGRGRIVQRLVDDARVASRGARVGMAEQVLNGTQIVGVLVSERGAGVAQGVIGQSRPLEVQRAQVAVNDNAHAAAAGYRGHVVCTSLDALEDVTGSVDRATRGANTGAGPRGRGSNDIVGVGKF